MAESILDVLGCYAMFVWKMNCKGDRILDWFHDSVTKTIVGFSRHCKTSMETSLELI